ncbi:DinB superfamily protein [Gracilibacillus ureilyticus]|uniref:DinB superfamily protein n=1 Tax=Gracilibacillus ureilyticus TaxID=531814 RepID=A0A1H9NEH3_9BACI|nr:DinB family protein [Gracilibacillus ureilyticus]SER34384.1 DinB superfamily protein [Gracilibacillus ureilyticus]
MDHLINQLVYARESTIEYVKHIDPESLYVIPSGFNNHVQWNLGHIYVAFEKIVFLLTGNKANFPDHFAEWFSPDTSPKNWDKEAPSGDELIGLLEDQLERLHSLSSEKVDQPILETYTTSTGFSISTIGECLSFIIHHEGMHLGMIKSICQSVNKNE